MFTKSTVAAVLAAAATFVASENANAGTRFRGYWRTTHSWNCCFVAPTCVNAPVAVAERDRTSYRSDYAAPAETEFRAVQVAPKFTPTYELLKSNPRKHSGGSVR